jgi:hypothetical protein
MKVEENVTQNVYSVCSDTENNYVLFVLCRINVREILFIGVVS